MEWICKWFIRYYSQQQWHTDQFRWYYQRLKVFLFHTNSSVLRIKAKFSLTFIHALILLLGCLLLLARRSAVCRKKLQHSLLIPPKHENKVVRTIHVPVEGFGGYTPVSFCFHSFHEQLEDYGVNGIWLMGWKPFYVTKGSLPVNP